MFARLAQLMYRRRWYVIGAWVLILAVAGSQAAQVNKVLGQGDFTQKGSDSARAAALLDTRFHQNDLKVSLVVLHARHGTVAGATFRRAVTGTVARIRTDRPLRIVYLDNPLVSGNRQLISRDGRSVALLVSSSLPEPRIEDQITHLRALARTPGFDSYVTGTPASNYDYSVSSKQDLARGDSIAIPILLIILLLVFGTLVAAGLPFILSACSIVLSLAVVYLVGHVMATSIYVTNIVMFLGLGIGIDYSLFIVYRFREELARLDGEVEAAVVRTMETTGRAVFFSGLTVAIGLSSLILTNLSFMQSMGLGGMLVPLTSILAALTLLPAVLGVLGARVNRGRIVPRRFLRTGSGRGWHRLAGAIMRRPIVAGGLVLLVLGGLALPATRLTFAFGSLKNAPPHVESVQGVTYMRDHFPSAPEPMQIVIQHAGSGTVFGAAELRGIRSLETALRRDAGVTQVVGPADFAGASGTMSDGVRRQITGRYLSADGTTAIVTIISRSEVGTQAAEQLVRRTRDVIAAQGSRWLPNERVYVGGSEASYIDFDDALYSHFPLILGIVLVLSYLFLFYAFRSAFLPLKAVLMNLLSVAASYGALVLVFQGGVGSRLLGFSPESGVASWVPIFLFAFLFGLSMDYEVFLLSRIREGWLDTRENAASVAVGLEKTGRLITSAAAIMVVAFSGMLVGHQIQLKEFGVGLIASIILDATLIRLVLVPAVMGLMGTINWWVPGFLRGFAEGGASLGEAFEPEFEELDALTA